MSPRSPRNVSGQELIKLLKKLGYQIIRQKGSHIRLSCVKKGNTHHITIPNHDPLKLGTLNSILSEVSAFLQISKEELIDQL
jgi:predicted RNA binding protein YcfA (HicA-like mRNA interferase family)